MRSDFAALVCSDIETYDKHSSSVFIVWHHGLGHANVDSIKQLFRSDSVESLDWAHYKPTMKKVRPKYLNGKQAK